MNLYINIPYKNNTNQTKTLLSCWYIKISISPPPVLSTACRGAVESVMKEGTRLLKHKHAKSEDKPVTDTT